MSNDSHNQTSLASKHSKREATLLENLLSREIKREKSHLLQIFRFMVNNSFFSEWPNKSLKFFQWSGEASNVNPEQAERQHLSYLSSITGIDEAHTELDEDDAPEKVVVDETGSSNHEDIEEGEIVEGEIE
jgi:cleavage and polyadenylation specificity factor subunit 4